MCGSEEDLLELDDVRMTEVAVADDFPFNMLCDLIAPLEQFIAQCHDKLDLLTHTQSVKWSFKMYERLTGSALPNR